MLSLADGAGWAPIIMARVFETHVFDDPQTLEKQSFIAGSLESAYSLNWGTHEIWEQDLGSFMISRPIYKHCDCWKSSIWNYDIIM